MCVCVCVWECAWRLNRYLWQCWHRLLVWFRAVTSWTARRQQSSTLSTVRSVKVKERKKERGKKNKLKKPFSLSLSLLRLSHPLLLFLSHFLHVHPTPTPTPTPTNTTSSFPILVQCLPHLIPLFYQHDIANVKRLHAWRACGEGVRQDNYGKCGESRGWVSAIRCLLLGSPEGRDRVIILPYVVQYMVSVNLSVSLSVSCISHRHSTTAVQGFHSLCCVLICFLGLAWLEWVLPVFVWVCACAFVEMCIYQNNLIDTRKEKKIHFSWSEVLLFSFLWVFMTGV